MKSEIKKGNVTANKVLAFILVTMYGKWKTLKENFSKQNVCNNSI